MVEGATPKKLVIRIRSWPKMIFLWPTVLCSLIVGLWLTYTSTPVNVVKTTPEGAVVASTTGTAVVASAPAEKAPDSVVLANPASATCGTIFLIILGINFTILTFDFPRTTSLTFLFSIVAVVLSAILINQRYEFVPAVVDWLERRDPSASPEFYFIFFGINLILFIGMAFSTRFDYWELSANELIHHTGLLGDIERYSTAGLKLNKEITDVFEYILAGSGTIVMSIPGTPRPVVLVNVLRIGYVERRADEILNAKFVRVESDAATKSAEDNVVRTESES
ncbi:MAG TPA: hypothetical protein VGE52_17200 [Pirellulales bacterium]